MDQEALIDLETIEDQEAIEERNYRKPGNYTGLGDCRDEETTYTGPGEKRLRFVC